MPSFLKYRIKHASESKTSLYQKELIPEESYKNLEESGYLSSTDQNIKPHTCAYIQKVRVGEVWYYLCGIKIWTNRADLIHSSAKAADNAPETKDKSLQARVSGADEVALGEPVQSITLSDGSTYQKPTYPADNYFKCRYCDSSTGEAKVRTIGGELSPIVEFPMCNCYTPRGGLQVTLFDGAVKGGLATGYTSPKDLPNVADDYAKYNKDSPTPPPPSFVGPVPPYVSSTLQEKFPAYSKTIGALFMLLNARASIVPCCWWKKSTPLLYKPNYFKAIDLAVAQKKAASRNTDYNDVYPNMSRELGVSDRVEYTTTNGDYYTQGDQLFDSSGALKPINEEEAYLLNILFGRNYDYTLPETGNNRRVIYTLDTALTGLPTKKVRDEDKGANPTCPDVWHFDSEMWFSPRNCGHPSCITRYTWGHVCNGGGAYSLDDGSACPYYENPLMGDRFSTKFSKLQNMYPGDSINGAIMLELMWMCKGGYPWTEEEWKDTWLVPYIWTTLPYNPVFYQTDKFTDAAGNVSKGFMHHEYHVYSRKAKIDPTSGKIELMPMKKLPGGSVSAFKRRQDQTLEDGLRVPDVPSLVQKLELRTLSSVRIIWPCPDVKTAYSLDISSTTTYTEAVKRQKNYVYYKLVSSKSGLKTLVVGHARTTGAIYCVNTAFLQGGPWSSARATLENYLVTLQGGTSACQKLLKEFWRDLIKAEAAGDPILKGMSLLKTYVTDMSSMFVFQDVPLSPIDNPNHIIVFSHIGQVIDADIIKIGTVIRRGYAFQEDTNLMTSWKTVWNGRPSLFFREDELVKIRPPLDKGKLQISKGTISLSVSNITGCSLSGNDALYSQIESLMLEIKNNVITARNITQANEKKILTSQIDIRYTDLTNSFTTLAESEKELFNNRAAVMASQQDKDDLVKEIEDRIKKVNTYKASSNYLLTSAKDSAQTDLTPLYTKSVAGWEQVAKALQEILSKVKGMPQDPEDPDRSSKDSTKLKRYSYKNLSKDAAGGDTDTDEGGVIVLEKDYTPEVGTPPVKRLYVPYLTNYKPNHRDLDKYYDINSIDQASDLCKVTIPKDSGLATWGNFIVSQTPKVVDVQPSYSFPSKAAKKVVVYSTRDIDKSGGSSGGIKGQKMTDAIGKWYKFPSCSSLVLFIMNPDIFNNFTEAMIFSISAKVSYTYKNASGEDKTETKTVKFVPIDYTQVSRSFPGYTKGKITRNLGTETKDGMNYTMIEISEDINIIEKEETGKHPWIFFAIPVSEDTPIKEWRYYNNTFFPAVSSYNTVSLPSVSNADIYIEYAYIAEIYDENASEAYTWANGKLQTRMLFGHPKAGIMKTVFKYTGTTIDGFTSTPISSHTMATMWPHARIACRDYEITYIWRDTYKGEELSSGNMQNRTATNWAAAYVANKTQGKDKQFTQVCIGDHDLGTEFQPKISFNTKTSTNTTAGTRFKITRAEWSSTFTDKTTQNLENRNPTYGFPSVNEKVYTYPESSSQPVSMGALYFPYTRSEPGTAYVPRHRTYLWEMLDRWRNKLNKSIKLFGSFRLQGTDWCVRGTDVSRIRKWKRHWIYDPSRETKFIGRSKTRGPVFQLEYREYYEMPTKTVFLLPYVATTGGEAEDCYCPSCNLYFKKTTSATCAQSICPYPTHKQSPEDKSTPTSASYRDAHWMTMLNKVESETTAPVVETLTQSELDKFVPKDPDRASYKTWKQRITTLYNDWKGSNGGDTTKKFEALQREQAKGRKRGWLANIYGKAGLEFIEDEVSTTTTEAEQASEKSEVDMTTGCDKFGTAKRRDLGSFQMSDGYVPGSVDPYLGTDPNSAAELEYFKLKEEAKKADSAYKAAKGDTDRYKAKEKNLSQSSNTSYTEGGTVYTKEGNATYTSGGAPTAKIDDKIAETSKIEAEKKKVADEKTAKLKKLNSSTARGQAREDLATKAEQKRAEVEKKCMRYYEYQQQSYGYNYPWSPFDSPPLFGNTGREMLIVEMCTIGSKISWLPRVSDDKMQMPKVKSTYSAPAIPSWWTARDPEGAPKEMVTLLAPPTECSRAILPLHTDAQNPYYNYVFIGKPFEEVEPTLADYDFANKYSAKDIRIVTQYNPDHSGEPFYRSDAGRFVLIPKESSSMRNIYVSENTPLYDDNTQNEFDDVTAFAADKKESETKSTSLPDVYINGKEVKGFSVKKAGTLNVGDYYPGYEGTYNYGKFFVGYKKANEEVVHWAWPEAPRDKVVRAIKLEKCYPSTLELPDPVTGKVSGKVDYTSKTEANQGIWSIPSIECAPYFRKQDTMDDGREISGGPTLKEDKSKPAEEEKKYMNTFYGIVVESERVEGGSYRPPLIWVEELAGKDTSGVSFSKPSLGAQPHRVMDTGKLQVVSIAVVEGSSQYTTGSISNISNMNNPTKGANLYTSKNFNASGYWPGFRVGNINYKTVGKVFNENLLDASIYGEYRVKKEASIAGQNNHRLTSNIKIPNFESNAVYLKLKLNESVNQKSLESYLKNVNDSVAIKIIVKGTPVAGNTSTSVVSYMDFISKLPITNQTSEVIVDLNFDITKNLEIEIQFLVTTDPGNFLLGPWKGKETKIVTTTEPTYTEKGIYNGEKDVTKEVPDDTNFCYLKYLVNEITIGRLSPGKCVEVVEVSEVGFVASTGKGSDIDLQYVNFHTQTHSSNYKANWEVYDKKLEKDEGWWKNSGRTTDADARDAGVQQSWTAAAEQTMVENWRATEGKDSQFGKEPKASIFPKACIEIPELPISRLKINTWNYLNNNGAPTVEGIKDPEPKDSSGKTSWLWGGMWTTRVAGPEWVTGDEFPSRDIIWWPALPFQKGSIVLKGRAFGFGDQYKDEAMVISPSKRRQVEPTDTYNEFAYKYEVRGFDALLKKIQIAENDGAEERRSAANQREYGKSYANNYDAQQSIMNNSSYDSSNKGYYSQFSGRDAAEDMAKSAAQGLSTAGSRNYKVADRRTWVLLDEVSMKVDEVTWEQLKKREEIQEELFNDAQRLAAKIGISNDTVDFKAIIPYYDWKELTELTGSIHLNTYNHSSRGYQPLTFAALKEFSKPCRMRWKKWDWSEVSSFTFRSEFTNRYPMTENVGTGWQNILVRKCGTRWAHKDTELDGGKIWEKWDDEWAKFIKRGRARVKKNHPVIVITDCKKVDGEVKDCIKEKVDIEDNNAAGVVDGGGGTTTDKSLSQKWRPSSVYSSWPSSVSSDKGNSFKRPDPWWRY